MSTAEQYRQYAAECLESARTSTSEDVRKQFLNLAQTWTIAAQQIDDGVAIAAGRYDQGGQAP